MQAHMHLTVKRVEERQTEGKSKRSKGWFSKFNRFVSKSIGYYQDKELRKMGAPFIWTE